jgi:membrane protease YdiL (CAAX protease family)
MINLLSENPALIAGLAAIAAILIYGPMRDKVDKKRLSDPERPNEKLKIYSRTMIMLWGLAAICTLSWLGSGQSLAELGFRNPEAGWRAWTSWGLAAAGVAYMIYAVIGTATSRENRDEVRRQIVTSGDLELMRPRSAAEHGRFQWISLTAGITEEVIFRGFLIGVFAMVFPVWIAASIATAVFVLAHLYQGPSGMLRILPVSAGLALIFVIGGSLWPVMILHALTDGISGGIVRIVDHFESDDAKLVEA